MLYYCNIHNKMLNIFCCENFICKDCDYIEKKHINHTFEIFNEKYNEIKKRLVQKVDNKIDYLEKNMKKLITEKEEIEKKILEINKKIDNDEYLFQKYLNLKELSNDNFFDFFNYYQKFDPKSEIKEESKTTSSSYLENSKYENWAIGGFYFQVLAKEDLRLTELYLIARNLGFILFLKIFRRA
jgi:hypothetical protein